MLHLSIARFALINVALVTVWIGVALVVLRRHDALCEGRAYAA
jgi:hypothetical protein